MENRFLRLHRLQALSQVPRWSIVPTLPRQSVGEHTLNVALLVWWCMTDGGTSDLNPRETTSAVMLSIFHDAAECVTADIPTPAKDLDRAAADSLERRAVSALGLEQEVGHSKHPVVAFCDLADALAVARLGRGSLAAAVAHDLGVALEHAFSRALSYPGVSTRAVNEVYRYAFGGHDVAFGPEQPQP